jgi:hypothetical protein
VKYMFRIIRRATAVAAASLLGGAMLVPSAQADVATFPDPGGHITGVRISHGPKTVGVTAYDAEMTLGTHYQFWLDTNPHDPGPEYRVNVIPNAGGSPLRKVANFHSPGTKVKCNGLRATADVFGEDYAKIVVPRSCIGNPSKVRVAVRGYYGDEHPAVVDWAPGKERFTPWVHR